MQRARYPEWRPAPITNGQLCCACHHSRIDTRTLLSHTLDVWPLNESVMGRSSDFGKGQVARLPVIVSADGHVLH